MFAWSRDWTTLLPLRKTLYAFFFHFCRLLKQYDMHCTRYGLDRSRQYKRVESFFDGKVQGYSFRPPKSTKPQNKIAR